MSLGYETKSDKDADINTLLKQAEDYMYRRKMTENLLGRGNAINAIMTTFQEKNEREREHSVRESHLCRIISEAMGFSDEQAADMEIAGLVHDIGKIAVSDAVLNKKGRLNEGEWLEMKQHPEIGCRILCASNEMLEIAETILAHHERWDGSGYPKGLAGKEIPLQARILAVADSYDAITSIRPYKRKMSAREAVLELKRCAGAQFDPAVVRVFVESVLGFQWDECAKIEGFSELEQAGEAV
jgi:HD-GYP domain-containing protein (c-di-GMP phosphodiesterase class II)